MNVTFHIYMRNSALFSILLAMQMYGSKLCIVYHPYCAMSFSVHHNARDWTWSCSRLAEAILYLSFVQELYVPFLPHSRHL